jgi:hypothetical protein
MQRWRWGAGSVAAVTLAWCSASALAAAPTISSVTFTGSQAHPVVTIIGQGFGHRPSPKPDYHPPAVSHPLCAVKPVEAPSRYGYDFGTRLFLEDSSAQPVWAAGRYRPGLRELDCVGLLVKTYTPTKIVFALGAGYPTIPGAPAHYALADGDTYVIGVDGAQSTGQVHYS